MDCKICHSPTDDPDGLCAACRDRFPEKDPNQWAPEPRDENIPGTAPLQTEAAEFSQWYRFLIGYTMMSALFSLGLFGTVSGFLVAYMIYTKVVLSFTMDKRSIHSIVQCKIVVVLDVGLAVVLGIFLNGTVGLLPLVRSIPSLSGFSSYIVKRIAFFLVYLLEGLCIYLPSVFYLKRRKGLLTDPNAKPDPSAEQQAKPEENKGPSAEHPEQKP